MRGKDRACDTCRTKKVRCEGSNPCRYCQNHSIGCTYNDIPKRIAVYSKSKKQSIVSLETTTIPNDKYTEIRTELSKIKYLLDNVLTKLEEHNYDNKTDTPILLPEPTTFTTSPKISARSITEIYNKKDARIEESLLEKPLIVRGDFNNSMLESYDKMTSGDYFSISKFSVNGLMWATGRIKDPFVGIPVQNLISNFSFLEHSLLSVWIDPVDSSRLDDLPSRAIINTVLDEDNQDCCLFDQPYVKDVLEIARLYCDYRDGLAPRPNFSYGELLFLNSCLLVGCTIYYYKLIGGIVSSPISSPRQMKMYEEIFLDNSLYYFHRVSLCDDGIDSIKGLTLLCIYTDVYSLTQPYYSIATYIVRRAQDLGLHREEYYYPLNETEKYNTLHLWWNCYHLDKFSALKTGKFPMINDESVTAPPLSYLQEYCDNFGDHGPRTGLRRNELHEDICQKNKYIISSQNGIKNFYFIMKVDLAIIISKLNCNLLSCNSLERNQYFSHVDIILNDLENWKLCLPESMRPIPNSDETTKFACTGVCAYFVVCDLNITFYYLKMVLSMLAARNSTGLDQHKYARQGLESAKDLLKLAVDVSRKSLQCSGISLFYTFSAFLTLATFCIQDSSKDNIFEDVLFLMDCHRELFCCFTPTENCPEKWILVGAVSRCVLYVTVHIVTENNEKLCFDMNDLLDEVTEIQGKLKFKHFSSSLHDNDQKVPKISGIPVSCPSSNSKNSYFGPPSFNIDQPSNEFQISNRISSSNLDSDFISGSLKESYSMESEFISNGEIPANVVGRNLPDNISSEPIIHSQFEEFLSLTDVYNPYNNGRY